MCFDVFQKSTAFTVNTFYTAAIITNNDLRPDSSWSDILVNDFWGTPLQHSGSHKSYRPVCVATFKLNYLLREFEPFGYHLINVILLSSI